MDEELQFATNLSHYWKEKAHFLQAEISGYINFKNDIITDLLEDDNEEELAKQLEERDELEFIVIELNTILDEFETLPLPISIVVKISSFEIQLYKMLMTNENLDMLVEETEEMERAGEKMNQIIEEIDRMWDDNQSEEDIKNYIYETFQEMFPSHVEEILRNIADNFFIFATQEKNVRVNLSDDEIVSLKREIYKEGEEVCGTCLEDFVPDENTIVLHCRGNHRFHEPCIIPWLKMSVFCPICKEDLRKDIS